MKKKPIFEEAEEWLRYGLNKYPFSKEISVQMLCSSFDIPNGKYVRGWESIPWDPTIKWTGFIMKAENHVFNESLFSIFDGRPLVLRGYPRAKKINNPSFKTPMLAQPSYDGIRVEFFRLPNGKLQGKTAQSEYLNHRSFYARNYEELIEKTGLLSKINKFLEDYPDLLLVGELYGYHEAISGFIDYDVEEAWIGLDILDRRTFYFLNYEESKMLFEKYELPFVKVLDEQEIAEEMKNGEGVIYKSYYQGDIYLNKKLSEKYKKLKEEPESLDGKRVQVCLREVYEHT